MKEIFERRDLEGLEGPKSEIVGSKVEREVASGREKDHCCLNHRKEYPYYRVSIGGAAMAKKKPDQSDKLPPELTFDYIKSNFHHVVHCDGVWGGVTPRASIIMSFWSERPPIPQQVTYEVAAGGKLGDEIKPKRKGRDAIVREVEVSVLMNLGTAKSLLTWLQDKVSAVEAALQADREGQNGGSDDRL